MFFPRKSSIQPCPPTKRKNVIRQGSSSSVGRFQCLVVIWDFVYRRFPTAISTVTVNQRYFRGKKSTIISGGHASTSGSMMTPTCIPNQCTSRANTAVATDCSCYRQLIVVATGSAMHYVGGLAVHTSDEVSMLIVASRCASCPREFALL